MGLPERYSLTLAHKDPRQGPRAINPNLVLVVRFLLTALVCGLSLATTIMCLLVVVYYNTNDPIIRPSWGSLIFLIILGFFTPIIYFGYNIFLPLMPFIRYGSFLYSLFMVKLELVLQFVMCVLWVSGALAYASDLRGYENCLFDGYLHYTKPDDFMHACDLINWAVPLAYATFGVQVLLWFVETVFGMYTFLLLDQESLNEPHFAWGRRAYDWAHSREAAEMGGSRYNNNGSKAGSSVGSGRYRARAVGAGAAGVGAGAAGAGMYRAGSDVSSAGRRGGGRRGAAYNDPEALDNQSDRYSGGSLGSEENILREEEEYEDDDPEMAETQTSGPLNLGRRGRRGYAEDEESGGRTSPRRGRDRDGDEEGTWHLRE